MSLPPRLETELASLDSSHVIEIVEESDCISLIVRNFELGDGYSVPNSDLLVRMPRSYPDAGPDMFWTDPAVTLVNGQIPQSAESIEGYVGRQWRRFSWHRQPWNPRVDNLSGYLEFVRKRLRGRC
jgi:hypothetical protein